MNILFIDDKLSELRLFQSELRSLAKDKTFSIYWANSIPMGVEYTSPMSPTEFDVVVCDINGTSLDFQCAIKDLIHPNIIITSGIVIPMEGDRKFVDKRHLAEEILKIIK